MKQISTSQHTTKISDWIGSYSFRIILDYTIGTNSFRSKRNNRFDSILIAVSTQRYYSIWLISQYTVSLQVWQNTDSFSQQKLSNLVLFGTDCCHSALYQYMSYAVLNHFGTHCITLGLTRYPFCYVLSFVHVALSFQLWHAL